MPLPSNVGHGTVTGRFIDTSGSSIEGKVRFTPTPKRLLNASASPSPVTILPKPVEVTLNDGAFVQALIATNDPDNNPVGWNYRVEFLFVGAAAESFSIDVPEGSSIDLTTVTPVASGNGTMMLRGHGVPDWSDATDGQVVVLVNGEPAWGTVAGGAPAVHTHAIADVTGLQPALNAKLDASAAAEVAQDAVAAMLQGASGVSLSYNDTANTLTITGGGTAGLDAEAVRDAIGVALVGTSPIQIVVNDAADTITFQLNGLIPIANAPAGTTITIRETTPGTYPVRGTARTDITVMWVGTQAPTKGGSFMADNDIWLKAATA